MAFLLLVLCLFHAVDGAALILRSSSYTLHDPEPQRSAAQKGLRGGFQSQHDIRESYDKLEKLATIPNHWDVPLMIPEEDNTWYMFARVVEKDVMLAVHKWYLVSWCAAVAFLLLLTGAFVAFSRALVAKDCTATVKPFQEVPTGESEPGNSMKQKGFVSSAFGTSIFWLWVLLPLLGYIQMGLMCLDHYFFNMHEPDLTWNQWAEPYLLVFFLSHITLFLQTQFLARARVFFMLQAPLADATKVLIYNTESATADGALVEVQDVDVQMVANSGDGKEVSHNFRYYEHTCIRYLWSDADQLFSPVGTESGLSGKEAEARVRQGGLSREQLNNRKIVGPNQINVPVPGVLASLGEEFLTPLYCFQFAAIWLYLFIDGWNIALIWVLWTLCAGISKSLWVVRRNRLRVQELAHTEARSTVLREGKWCDLASEEVVPGDVVLVAEDTVCCDAVLVEGGAVVNESMLTGEPMPVQRFSVDPTKTKPVSTLSDKNTILFTGTIVMQSAGAAESSAAKHPDGQNRSIAVVLNTGAMTMKGCLIRTVLFPEPVKFKFTDQLPRVYLFMFLYVCGLFGIMQVFADPGSGIFKLFIGCTILVQSLNPLLPVSITFGQTVGSEKLTQDYGIKCLNPQRLPIAGKVHIFVMDKTGTITKEGMEIRGAHVAEKNVFADTTWANDGQFDGKSVPEEVSLALAACHTVTRLRNSDLVGNMVEVAMLNASGWELSADSKSVSKPSGEQINILKQLEFDQTRMTSGAVIEFQGKKMALIKGSYERIGQLATSNVPADYKDVTEGFAADQYYVLGIGMKLLGADGEKAPRQDLEQGLKFVGLFLFRNEMKVDSPAAVLALKEGGTRAVICTGDNALTGAAIGRQVGLIAPDKIVEGKIVKTQVLLGDVPDKIVEGKTVKGSLCWTRLSDKADIPHTEVLESHEDAELVVTKVAFKEMKLEELLQLRSRLRVFARMKPDDKVAVVQFYQNQDLVVGMVGDGGNDCAAMRAAHVGLALSDAEASIVAPFSSGEGYGTDQKSLMAVPHLLRYGRATLQTNSGTFLFFIVYGLTLPNAKLVMTILFNSMMAEWDWLFIDIVLGVIFVILMTSCRPAEKLAPIRPTGALLEGRSLSSVLLHAVMFFAAYALALKMLWIQPFYVEYNTVNIGIPAHEWPKKGDNYDCTITFLVLAVQLVTAGYAGCLGAEHRTNLLKSSGLTVAYVVIMGFLLSLVIGGPSNLHCIFRTNCDSYTSRNMNVPGLQQFSAGTAGGCFLGPQLQGWKEELGDRWQFPDEGKNMCFPADGFDPEEKLQVKSEALFGLGAAMCLGPNNCFSGSFRVLFSVILVVQSGFSILCHKLLLLWHPAPREHFKTL